MKKSISLFAFLILCIFTVTQYNVNAQDDCPGVLNASGGYSSADINGIGNYYWSIGEIIVGEQVSDGNVIVCNGFIPPMCPPEEMEGGCMDETACNYNPNAINDNGSCIFPVTWFADMDGNGLGDPNNSMESCEDLSNAGYVTNADDNAECELIAIADVTCAPLGNEYQVMFVLDEEIMGSGYGITNNMLDETIALESYFFITDFFPAGTGYSYTLFLLDNPDCSVEFTVDLVDCTTTAVDFLGLNGTVQDRGNELYWSTASEKGSDSFVLQRSDNGTDFYLVDRITANGNTNTIQNYNYLDSKVNNQEYYYRLLETNTDGISTIVSNVIRLDRGRNQFEILAVAPLPATDFVTIEFNYLKSENLTYEIVDITGKKITSQPLEVNEGYNSLRLNIQNYPAGNYFLNLISPLEGSQTIRFVKED